MDTQDTRTGISLSAYTTTLEKVPDEQVEQPFLAHAREDLFTKKYNADLTRYLQAYYEDDDLGAHLHDMPAAFFSRMDVNLAAQAMLSMKYCMGMDKERELERNPELRLVRKIDNSIWQWSETRGERDWNAIVDAYNGFSSLDLGIDGFEIRVDYTTGYNAKGYSEHARLYLDGMIGLLVHWKGQHVMTIGISFISGRRILLQQVQAVSKVGNRWMFKMPANRLEFIIDRLTEAFPHHSILVADGADYAKRSLGEYQEAIETRRERIARHKAMMAQRGNDAYRTDVEEEEKAIAILEERIANLIGDSKRIVALYRDTGRWQRGKPVKARSLRHYPLAA